jgi:hypothetical protein
MMVRSPERLFNLYLVERALRHRSEMNGTFAKADLRKQRRANAMQLLWIVARYASPHQRISVVGNGNIDGGKKSPTRKPGQPRAGILGGNVSPAAQLDAQKIERPRVCGAMAQQCGQSGNDYAPQKFVRLVGYRDPNPRPETWVRPRPAQAKP